LFPLVACRGVPVEVNFGAPRVPTPTLAAFRMRIDVARQRGSALVRSSFFASVVSAPSRAHHAQAVGVAPRAQGRQRQHDSGQHGGAVQRARALPPPARAGPASGPHHRRHELAAAGARARPRPRHAPSPAGGRTGTPLVVLGAAGGRVLNDRTRTKVHAAAPDRGAAVALQVCNVLFDCRGSRRSSPCATSTGTPRSRWPPASASSRACTSSGCAMGERRGAQVTRLAAAVQRAHAVSNASSAPLPTTPWCRPRTARDSGLWLSSVARRGPIEGKACVLGLPACPGEQTNARRCCCSSSSPRRRMKKEKQNRRRAARVAWCPPSWPHL